jgi:hypothetical protein
VQFSVADFLTDIVQNSIEAGASVITVDVVEDGETLTVYIGDNGKGMDEETLTKVKDPYYTNGVKHENRKVGLGIPFLIQSVEHAGGKFDIQSNPEMGTSVSFSFDPQNIDCPPLGDITSAFRSLMIFGGTYEMVITRSTESGRYSVTTSELLNALGELTSSESLVLAKKYLDSLEEDLIKKGA